MPFPAALSIANDAVVITTANAVIITVLLIATVRSLAAQPKTAEGTN